MGETRAISITLAITKLYELYILQKFKYKINIKLLILERGFKEKQGCHNTILDLIKRIHS